MTSYINVISDSSERLFDGSEEYISLPPEMKELEIKLNHFRSESIKNKKLAEENEKKKDELIVYLAHDIKTPLTVVIGYLSLLDEIEDMPLKQRKKYIELALNKSYRLEELINELFDIARFNSEKIILEKEELNLNIMLEQVIEDFYPILKEINKNNNTDKKNSSGIAVLNYHAFYDENNAEEKANCTTEICHSKKQFKSQLNLIKEKDMLTLQMKEVEMYIDGKVQLPKSVLITIDDGPKTKIAVDLLTEYKMYATIFLVTSWFDEKEYYKTDYIELHSHTHNMHDGGKCPGGQGGAIKCLPEEEIQKDLKQSREELNGSTVFCYPFYEYNDYSIKMLKQAGFTMAFIGESNNSDNLIHVGSDKFRLRRFVIVTYTTISDLNKYFDQIK